MSLRAAAMIAGRLASGVVWADFSSDSALLICAWIGGLRFLWPSTTRASRVSASPETIDHMSFHLPDMTTLRKALAHLKAVGVDFEDPGDEICPEAPSSKNSGLWFHDTDGYRWELSVLGGRLATDVRRCDESRSDFSPSTWVEA
jgi:hypothetical protein